MYHISGTPMSLSTQPGNPQDDPPWEQDPSTKRWYTPWIDDRKFQSLSNVEVTLNLHTDGNYTRWYYEDWYEYQVGIGAIK